MNRQIILSLMGLFLSQSLIWAQPPMGSTPSGGQPGRTGAVAPQKESPEIQAARKTQKLREMLNLSSDQYNKVYQVYYRELCELEEYGTPGNMMPGEMPPGGMPSGGMPPAGMSGGFPNGMPPAGFEPPANAPTPQELQKMQQHRQKKMKKILTEEQYELWFKYDTELPEKPIGF